MSTTAFVGQSIDFDEIEGSPTRTHGNGHPVITVQGMTAWSDVDGFISYLMPVGTSIGGQFGAKLAANQLFRVFDYSVEGFGGMQATGTNGLNTFRLAKWSIKCHVPTGQNLDLTQPYNNDPVPWLNHEMDVGGQRFTLPRQSLKWQSDSAPITQQATGAIFIATQEHNITWPRLQNPPFAAIRLCANCINNAPVTYATGVIATGQGLFLGAKVRSESMSDGTLVRTLTYKISERCLKSPNGTNLDWNYCYRDDAKSGGVQGWDRPINVATGAVTYNSANFASLFPNTF
jgi:hypothetical protein